MQRYGLSVCRRGWRGFTLIEMMVTVAIVGILAAIAIPNYSAYIRRGNRAEARGSLLEAASFMQRCFSQNNSFAACALPAGLATVPNSGGAARYTIAFDVQVPLQYTLRATRAGTMAADECGDFTLTNTGVQGLANNTVGMTVQNCWSR